MVSSFTWRGLISALTGGRQQSGWDSRGEESAVMSTAKELGNILDEQQVEVTEQGEHQQALYGPFQVAVGLARGPLAVSCNAVGGKGCNHSASVCCLS